jgi:DNA-binding response OmpR family regulator
MQTPKARILVVEDDPALLRGLLDVLVYNGYEVKGVEDGGRGLDAGLRGAFDLILLDVMLPKKKARPGHYHHYRQRLRR